jgi:hypothetical protein
LLICFFVLSFTATALDLPENPPDDFFISYKIKGAGGLPDFTFTASVSGEAFLEFKGKEGVLDGAEEAIDSIKDKVVAINIELGNRR